MNLGPGAVVVKKHDQFHLRCLASLERTEYQTLLYLKVVRWAGHLTCMEEIEYQRHFLLFQEGSMETWLAEAWSKVLSGYLRAESCRLSCVL